MIHYFRNSVTPNQNNSNSNEINKEWTNAGGIALSEMQGYLDNEIWALLPDDLQDVVSAVDRKYMDRKEEKIYQTKLFLPSVSEVFDEKNIYFELLVFE